MDLMQWLKTVPVIGAMALCPATAMAAKVKSCISGPPTPASYTWNFPREASHLLTEMRYDSQRVADHASKLAALATDPQIDAQLHSRQLDRIKANIDDMGRRLCRLEQIRRVASPWEQQAIGRVAPLVRYMADNTDDAIHYLNAHEGQFWVPSYRANLNKLYTEARTVSRRIHGGQELATAPGMTAPAASQPGA